ncbi:MAG: hypothetical protein RLZZ126_873 [Pseudomonadota bacterium]|jgi:muramoyltetrapeptide carboxypeptidase
MTGKHLYIYSPSGAVRDKAAFRRGVAFLKARGYDVELDEAALSSHQRFAGTDEIRLAAIGRAAASGADAALISRGGYGITRILPDIPYTTLSRAIQRGTQFVGISDFTALQLALMAKSGAGSAPVTWAGPALCEGFGATPAAGSARQDTEGHGEAPGAAVDDIMLACFEDMMLGQGEGCGWRQEAATAVKSERIIRHATLWGGNLTMLCSLVGTPFMPQVSGGILFLEDVAEHPYRIERMLSQLLHAGILQRQKAVLLGQFTEYKLTPHDRGYAFKSIVTWLQSRLPRVAVVTGLPFGHVPTKVLLPTGARCDLLLQGRDALLAWGHLR